MWVVNFADNTVSRISVEANEVVGNPIRVGTGPSAIASGPSGVWVANSEDNTIQRIDPVTGEAQAPIGVGEGPDGIAVDGRSLWVANGRDRTVSRIDASNGQAMTDPIPVGTGPRGIAVFGNFAWVADQLSQSVTRIDRRSLATWPIRVGDGPRSLAVLDGAIWVSDEFKAEVDRIQPTTSAVRRFPVGSSPRGLAVVGDRLWVAGGAFSDPAHRGGTLTVATEYPVDHFSGIDPADAYTSTIIEAERQVYDGLVAFRMQSGADSQVLVPDLAVALPRPSDGGRTYTFTIRSGIRYSNGGVVRASDFVLGVRRAIVTNQGNATFFTTILGGQACHADPAHCDLSKGVETDDTTGRVTFHLRAADPAFLYKLAYLVRPTPPGTPTRTGLRTPIPGTGPYMIASYAKEKTFILGRNPYFQQWSFAAQPAGYPDTINWIVPPKGVTPVDEVLSGSADVAQVLAPASPAKAKSLINRLRAQSPLQLHSDVLQDTLYLTPDPTVRPFNNLLARRALSHALDRNKMVELAGGDAFGSATCQLLPPIFPAYSWYCPYTRDTDQGRYVGPDLNKARELVTKSGTRGTPVTVYTFDGPSAKEQLNYLAQVLRTIGYQPHVQALPPTPQSDARLNDPGRHPQLSLALGWAADYPLPSNFYNNVVACHQLRYCNTALDEQAARAAAAEGTDPGAALRAWTEIDRQVTDLLPVIPFANSAVPYLVSKRAGNYQSSPTQGPFLSQLWIK